MSKEEIMLAKIKSAFIFANEQGVPYETTFAFVTNDFSKFDGKNGRRFAEIGRIIKNAFMNESLGYKQVSKFFKMESLDKEGFLHETEGALLGVARKMADDFKNDLTLMWNEVLMLTEEHNVALVLDPEEEQKKNLFSRILSPSGPQSLKITFINGKSPETCLLPPVSGSRSP